MRYNKNNYSTFLKNMLSLDIAPSTPTTFPLLFNKARLGKFQKIYKLGDGTFWLDKWKDKGDFGF